MAGFKTAKFRHYLELEAHVREHEKQIVLALARMDGLFWHLTDDEIAWLDDRNMNTTEEEE